MAFVMRKKLTRVGLDFTGATKWFLSVKQQTDGKKVPYNMMEKH